MSETRSISSKPTHKCYMEPKMAKVDQELYSQLSASGWDNIVQKFSIPPKQGKAWEMKAGQTCRIVLQGPQVGGVNMWSCHDFRERFNSGKTRQIQKGHLSSYDRLWSNMPYLRPIATITRDSLSSYGVDDDGCLVHDIIGTCCDPYMHRLINGRMSTHSCHQSLMAAVKPWGLQESDIHDGFNIFMCTGLTSKNHEFIVKGTPADKGDYIEWVAEIDLLVANSVCPYGDMSEACGKEPSSSSCYAMDVYLGQPSQHVIDEWKTKRLNT